MCADESELIATPLLTSLPVPPPTSTSAPSSCLVKLVLSLFHSMSGVLAEPKTSIIVGGRKRITAVYTDGTEVLEEFDVVTDDLLLRKRRHRSALGAYTEWVTEIGAEDRTRNVERAQIVEAAGSPEVVRQDTKEAHVIRIRNLPYPREVFAITVEHREGDAIGEIVVRTTNKKYFKRLDLPDMTRAGIPLEASHLSFDVKHNTLIIEYKKHLAVLAAEAAARRERASLPSKRVENEKEQCAQQ